MLRPNIGSMALGVLSLVFLAAAASCELQYRQYPAKLAGLTPVRVAIASGPVRTSFTAVWSEPHYVALVFPANVDPEIATMLDQATDTVGAVRENPVHFDFDWEVREGATEVGRGSGRSRLTGSFGSGVRGFMFGDFPAVVGHVYQLEARPGPAFQTWAAAKPLIEVGVNSASPSIGLPLVKEYSRPIAVMLAILGFTFLGGAVWTSTR